MKEEFGIELAAKARQVVRTATAKHRTKGEKFHRPRSTRMFGGGCPIPPLFVLASALTPCSAQGVVTKKGRLSIPPSEISNGYLRHMPLGSPITPARRGLQTEAKLAKFTA